ncbi:MAG: class I SAM-dependent methyltransferase [Candidatus Poseidoniaceae archaeon]|jgi:demethylmenaquinone methyltransferase/2-methoxy-6-polyprenyl-1,4-benzoquinol methylase|nr:class I SAM-dependent methyltransferase [Candidatus Poseidoniaceae archaeon]
MSDRTGTGGFDPSGIDDDAWTELEKQLEATIPVYDRVNRIMTLGFDKGMRRHVRNHAKSGMNVLEVGCGPGSFAVDLVGMELTCLDPSTEMLKVCRKRVDAIRNKRGEAPAKYVEAIAEDMPLPDNTFDRVFCLFSFRDFKDKKQGLSEIFRVLKPDGQLVICDAGKANKIHGLFGRLYMMTFVQWVARWVTKDPNHPWKWLAKTYTHYGTHSYYKKMLNEVGFIDVKARLLFPGMSSRFKAKKPQK